VCARKCARDGLTGTIELGSRVAEQSRIHDRVLVSFVLRVMMNIEYREIAVGTDLHRSEQALRDAVLRRPLGRSLSADEIDRDRKGRHFAGIADGRVVACVGLYPQEDGSIRLRHMAVAPGLQRQGVGARVLALGEAWARSAGITRIEMHARCTARGFYERAGYVAAGSEFLEHGIPHIVMWKTL
jgi:predicted GNAT family N-acyltransferase